MKPVNPRVLLKRMEAAHRDTRRHLDLVHRQIACRAERITITQKAKARHSSRKRSGTRWCRNDQMLLQAHLDRLQFERCLELDGLAGKLARQEQAIDTLRRKLGEEAGRRVA